MSNLDKFIEMLETEARNHSIYVWGAQGQKQPTITEAWIRSKETSATNANRAIAYWRKQVAAGYGNVLRAFDCSGLGVWILQQLGILKSTEDMTAATMYSKCTKLSRSELKRGDQVFCHNGQKIVHVGYVVNDNLDTIEAYGRDRGVVKLPLSEGEWNRFGRPPYFKDEILEGGDSMAKIKVLGNSVNVRTQPNTAAGILGVAHKGDEFETADNDWHCINYNGQLAWISGKPDLTKRVE